MDFFRHPDIVATQTPVCDLTFQPCLILNPQFSVSLTEQKISNAVIWDCKSASGRKGIQDVPKHAAEQCPNASM